MKSRIISQAPRTEVDKDLQDRWDKKAAARDPNKLQKLRDRNHMFRGTPHNTPAEVSGSIHDIKNKRELKSFISKTRNELNDYYKTSNELYKSWKRVQNKFVGDYEYINAQSSIHDDKGLQESFYAIIKEYNQSKKELKELRDLVNECKQGENRMKEIEQDQSGNYDEKRKEVDEIKTKQTEVMENYISQLTNSTDKYERAFEAIRNRLPSST